MSYKFTLLTGAYMSQNKVLLAILGAVVVGGGAGAVYYYFQQGGSLPFVQSDQAAASRAVRAIPQNALAVITINIDGEAIKKLEELIGPEGMKVLEAPFNPETDPSKEFQELQAELRAWGGDQVVIAVLPGGTPTSYRPINFRQALQAQATPALARGPNLLGNFVMVVEVKDQGGANKFLETNRTKRKLKSETKDYKGVTITIDTPEADSTGKSISAIADNVLVLGGSEAAVQATIDTIKGAPSIAGDLPTDAVQVDNPVFGFYAPNVDKNAQAIAELLAEGNNGPVPPNVISQLRRVNYIAVVAGVDNQGMRLRLAAKQNTDLPAGNSPNQIPALLPKETIGLLTGFNLKEQWAYNVRLAETDPDMKQAIELLRTAAKGGPLALDLDKDVFSWMDGEYGLALIPSNQGFLAQTGAGPVAILQSSNRPSAEAFLRKLDGEAEKNGLSVSTREVGGVKVTEWGTGPGAFLAHGWLKPDTMFITLSPLVSSLAPQPQSPLNGDGVFQGIIGAIRGNANGYFFLNMQALTDLVKKQVPSSEIPKEASVFLSSIKGIGVSYALPDPRTATLDALIALKRPTQQ